MQKEHLKHILVIALALVGGWVAASGLFVYGIGVIIELNADWIALATENTKFPLLPPAFGKSSSSYVTTCVFLVISVFIAALVLRKKK